MNRLKRYLVIPTVATAVTVGALAYRHFSNRDVVDVPPIAEAPLVEPPSSYVEPPKVDEPVKKSRWELRGFNGRGAPVNNIHLDPDRYHDYVGSIGGDDGYHIFASSEEERQRSGLVETHVPKRALSMQPSLMLIEYTSPDGTKDHMWLFGP